MGLGDRQGAIVQNAAGRICHRRQYWKEKSANAVFGVTTGGAASRRPPVEAAEIRLIPVRLIRCRDANLRLS